MAWHGMKVRYFTWDEYIMYMIRGTSMVKYTTPLLYTCSIKSDSNLYTNYEKFRLPFRWVCSL
jgi:hypothetical protein